MKIIFFASDNNKTSGAFISMTKLCSVLKHNFGHDILVILPCKGLGCELLEKEGIDYKVIKSYHWATANKKNTFKTNVRMSLRTMLNIVSEAEIKRLYKKEKPDIVHMNTTYTYVGAKVAKKCKIPFVWHLREFMEEDQNVKIWNRTYGYQLIDSANKIIAISHSIYKKYLSVFDKDKLIVILNGIEKKKFETCNHEIFQNIKLGILIIGTISENKGQRQAIEACKLLADEGCRNFTLKIVGRGEEVYTDKLKNYVRDNQLQDIIEFCGPQSEVEGYYRQGDITLVCSKAEAFGRTTVEAMMSGNLVIGADNAGTSELVKVNETGLLYESGNVADLKEKIKYAMENCEKMRKIAKSGQDFMIQNMTADINAAHVNDVYLQLLKQQNSSGININVDNVK